MILICVAGMPYAKAAVRLGGTVARATQSPVTLLHVIQRQAERTEGRRTLELAQGMLPGLEVKARIRQGDPTDRIAAEIRAGDYDLVVVGANEKTGLTQRLLGSVALQVVYRAPISVLIAKQARPSLARILIATGGLDVARPVIKNGARLAGAVRASVTLLHVLSPVPSMYTGLGEVEETLPKLLRSDTPVARHLRSGAEILNRHQVTAEVKLRHGVAVDEILKEAREGDYGLIIIGASGKTGRLRGWLLGNVTRQVVDDSSRSVLVVRQRL